MKNIPTFLVFAILFCTQQIVAQKFFKIANDVVDEATFKEGLALIAQEYDPQIVTYKTFERVTSKDSIIENISIVVLQEDEEEEVYRVFDFLGKPLPDFEFSDITGSSISKQKFSGKYTVVGLYKDAAQGRKAHIKSLNALVNTGEYNAVALIAKNGNMAGIAKRADFPVLNECISWYIDNISIPESPKFLVLDETGNLKYIFQEFPQKEDIIQPLDPVHLKIYDILR
ncbi:TlpA family protein disulfide reductase [Zobellia nedashkovskayae]